MAQHDYVIANDTAANVRSDLNDALSAIVSQNSGAEAPSTTYANMLWYDTSNNILKMRTEADDAWIDLGTLNQSTNEFEVANLTELTPTQAEDDTDTTYGTVTGEILAGAVAANASGGLTLLGTLTTTSGTTQTLSGLDLTEYKFLRVTVNEVRHDQGLNEEALEIDDRNMTQSRRGPIGQSLIIIVDLSNGIASAPEGSGPTTLSTASTSVSFTWSQGAAFDEGEIKIYGEA